MNTMLEKAASAAVAEEARQLQANFPRNEISGLAVARAVLLAIREPDASLFANPDACFIGFAQTGDEPEENVYLGRDYIWHTHAMDRTRREQDSEALGRILQADAAVLEALWRAFPSPYEIDCRDNRAARKMLRRVVAAASKARTA